MAKIKEREVAKKLYIDLNKSQKEIAEDLGITEKTVGVWVTTGNWKQLRNARLNNSTNRAEKFKAVLEGFADNQLLLQEQIADAEAKSDLGLAFNLKKDASKIADQVGKYQKALEKLEKDFKVSLSTHMEVMEDIFQEMHKYDPDLYLKTLDFQKYHLQNIAQKLG